MGKERIFHPVDALVETDLGRWHGLEMEMVRRRGATPGAIIKCNIARSEISGNFQECRDILSYCLGAMPHMGNCEVAGYDWPGIDQYLEIVSVQYCLLILGQIGGTEKTWPLEYILGINRCRCIFGTSGIKDKTYGISLALDNTGLDVEE